MRIAYAHVYVMLYRQRKRRGMRIEGIQKLAADAVGVGKGSQGDWQRDKTLRQMSSRFMKDPVVQAEIERLGLARNKVTGEWYDPELG